MKLKTVRAGQGLQWVKAGFRVFFREPLALSGIFAAIAFLALLLLQLPLLGPVLALGLMPVANVAFMIASREITLASREQASGREARRVIHPGLLVRPLRDAKRRRPLLLLGAVYAVAALAVVLLAHLLDGGRFAAAVQAVAENEATPELLSDPMLEFGVLVRLALMSALSLAFWHAPALVYWDGLPVGKAVFASVMACTRALGAFVLYGLAWFGLLLGFMVLAQSLFALLGFAQAMAGAALPTVMLFSTVFYASVYFSYVDSFDTEAGPAAGGIEAA